MKKYACKYVVLRFSPYSDTEEFANVGVLAYSKIHNVFLYKLDTIDVGSRVDHFFNIENKTFYKSTMSSYEKELNYMRNQVISHSMSAESAFEQLVQPRANLLSYGERRAVLTNDITVTLEKIFNRMVNHVPEH